MHPKPFDIPISCRNSPLQTRGYGFMLYQLQKGKNLNN
jgi:hypothetical protein